MYLDGHDRQTQALHQSTSCHYRREVSIGLQRPDIAPEEYDRDVAQHHEPALPGLMPVRCLHRVPFEKIQDEIEAFNNNRHE